jgi:hypothetical protein
LLVYRESRSVYIYCPVYEEVSMIHLAGCVQAIDELHVGFGNTDYMQLFRIKSIV